MDDPELYDKHSDLQKTTAADLIPALVSAMSWKTGEKILDLGCGSGYVTKEILLSNLENSFPDNTRTLVAVDISRRMVEFAANNYPHPQIVYEEGDIFNDRIKVRFDKIFSFYVIQWIPNWPKLFKRFYSLMVAGGEIAFFMPIACDIFSIWETMIKDPVWAPYCQKGDPMGYNPTGSEKHVCELMEFAGFQVQKSQTIRKQHYFPNMDKFLEFCMAINPIIRKIPEEVKPAFIEAHAQYLRQMAIPAPTPSCPNCVQFDLDIAVLRAHKKHIHQHIAC